MVSGYGTSFFKPISVMSISISKVDTNTYLVSGKEVFENMDNKLESKVPLSVEEKQALINFLNANNSEKKSGSNKRHSGSELRQELAHLDLKIESVKKQRDILDSKKDFMSEESIKLRNYYENNLQSYHTNRATLITNIPVRDATIVISE